MLPPVHALPPCTQNIGHTGRSYPRWSAKKMCESGFCGHVLALHLEGVYNAFYRLSAAGVTAPMRHTCGITPMQSARLICSWINWYADSSSDNAKYWQHNCRRSGASYEIWHFYLALLAGCGDLAPGPHLPGGSGADSIR